MERENLTLLTDLYQLTMMGGYFRKGMHTRLVAFEYFFRKLPGESGYAVLAGIEDMAGRLEGMRFGKQEVDWMASLKLFPPDFLDALSGFRFACDVDSAPEGSVVFPNEPLVRVQGELWQAQLAETAILNSLNYPTLIATKAARICHAAAPDPVIEFGLRRAPGKDGGMTGSRAAYIGGCVATSNVEAGRRFGIPVKGTHAHSWIMAYESEREAFKEYVDVYPDSPTLLVDTYNTLEQGIPNAIAVFGEARKAGWKGRASIRIDSGDLAATSIEAHRRFEEEGFADPLIIASNDLDEYLIADLKRQGAKINAWGVGTNLIVSAGAPSLGGVYKLCAKNDSGTWLPRIKISGNPEKTTDPGLKKVLRLSRGALFAGDLLCWRDEEPQRHKPLVGIDRNLFYRRTPFGDDLEAEELYKPLLREGRRVSRERELEEIRRYAAGQIGRLPAVTRRLRNPHIYPVLLSEKLATLKKQMIEAQAHG